LDKKKPKQVLIPDELYVSIVRIQANDGLDFPEAASKAARLIDVNGDAFRDAVRVDANRLAKSQFLKQLNVARESIREEGYEKGFDKGYDVGYTDGNQFHVPCSVCGKRMGFSDRDPNWSQAKATLIEAFKAKGWRHAKCGT
jgi:flagellar biosynthesis/type III secretory pathway protein FliH